MNKKNSEKTVESKPVDENEEKLRQTIKELTDTLQRLQADFENYKKRVDKEKIQVAATTKVVVLQKLLPIIDAFEIAAKSNEGEQLRKGMTLIQTELAKVMHALDVKPITAIGKRCDPHKHEVLMQEAREDCEDDMITEELQRGYTIGDLIVRTSKVKVAKKLNKTQENKHDTKEHTAQ